MTNSKSRYNEVEMWFTVPQKDKRSRATYHKVRANKLKSDGSIASYEPMSVCRMKDTPLDGLLLDKVPEDEKRCGLCRSR